MKLKEDMYVRTLDGICKCVELRDDGIMTRFRNEDGNIYFTNDMMCNPSFDVIDLIQEGDYVNGSEVVLKDFNNLNEECLECGIGDYIVCSYEVKDIKSIVTKEQFESIKYSLKG